MYIIRNGYTLVEIISCDSHRAIGIQLAQCTHACAHFYINTCRKNSTIFILEKAQLVLFLMHKD